MRPGNIFRLVMTAVLGWAIFGNVLPTPAQEMQGFPEDSTHHHVVFSNPGTLQDAIQNGTFDRWIRIVNDPRYRIQWMKRNARPAPPDDGGGAIIIGGGLRTKRLLHADWIVDTGSSNHSVALGMYAAKYTFSPIGDPDCVNDFVVFPIDSAGGPSQADLIGVNNLYNTTCTGTIPTVLFAYFIGGGQVQTSPVLSLDGTKLAFVESVTGGSKFHVLTVDKSGNAGCPSSPPCNGTAYNAPATPGVNNSAVDTKITMTGNVSVSISSPFVDYANDIAYVGDDTGRLHKLTGVFNGTLAEAGSPWPFRVSLTADLTGPTYDSISGNILVGGSNGLLYCVTSAGVFCSTSSITIGSGSQPAISDAPIVDSTEQTVFSASETSSNEVLVQATTSLGSPVTALMGKSPGRAQAEYNGAFDNAYFNNVSTGHMYFCGNNSSADNTLLRVSFNAAGTMASAPDSGSFALTTGNTVDCTPLTEIFNPSQGKDYLFLGVDNDGFTQGTPDCSNGPCVISFVLPTSSPFTFPTAANATLTSGLGTDGMSGFIVDNISGLPGASQIYFGNLQAGTGVQASQSALQ